MVNVSVEPTPSVARDAVSAIAVTAGGAAPVARTVTGVVSASVTEADPGAPGMFCSDAIMFAVPAFACEVTTPFTDTFATVGSVERNLRVPVPGTGLPGASGFQAAQRAAATIP